MPWYIYFLVSYIGFGALLSLASWQAMPIEKKKEVPFAGRITGLVTGSISWGLLFILMVIFGFKIKGTP
jgi:hypothetical protein